MAGTITVSEITAPITVGNSLTVSITSYAFSSQSQTLFVVIGSGQVFNNTDISNKKSGTFFIYNTGLTAVTISLQVSPTTTSSYYINTPSYSNVLVAGGTKALMELRETANYARLQYTALVAANSVAAYNLQS